LYVEINEYKKFFVVNDIGKNTVLKLIDNSIYYKKRLWVTLEQQGKSFETFQKEWKRLTKLREKIEKHKFKYEEIKD
jgi:hypothetical protein